MHKSHDSANAFAPINGASVIAILYQGVISLSDNASNIIPRRKNIAVVSANTNTTADHSSNDAADVIACPGYQSVISALKNIRILSPSDNSADLINESQYRFFIEGIRNHSNVTSSDSSNGNVTGNSTIITTSINAFMIEARNAANTLIPLYHRI